MFRFYVLIDCPKCDAEIHHGPMGSFLEHDGLPVIPFYLMAQTRMDCDECGAEIYTGDLDDFHVEPGITLPDEDSTDEDDGTCGDCAEGRCHGGDPEDCECDRHDTSREP